MDADSGNHQSPTHSVNSQSSGSSDHTMRAMNPTLNGHGTNSVMNGNGTVAPMFDYSSPSFSDNTSNSPEAILGNSNQAVSHLLNEDFMTWLLSRDTNSPSIVPATGANGSVVPNNFTLSEQPANQLSNIPLEYNYYDIDFDIMEGNHFLSASPTSSIKLEDTLANQKQLQSSPQSHNTSQHPKHSHPPQNHTRHQSTYPCSDITCQAIRQAINLHDNDTLLDKFIRPSFVSHAIDIYWSVHSRWPILHRPSFDINKAPPHLLVSMITISMYLIRDEDARELAIKIHDTFRYNIYMCPEFKAPIAIWVFQSLLLAEIFEMLTSTEEQHDMASRFYQVLIASMRQGGTMGEKGHEDDNKDDSTTNSGTASGDEDNGVLQNLSEAEVAWKSFIKREAKKRIAYFAFVLDTQHCAFFNKPPSVFISDLPFRLPCEEAVWEAEDADSWIKLKRSYPATPYFQQMISIFLKLESSSITHQLSPWNMMIIFHGLISVGWRTRLRESVIITGEEEFSPTAVSTNNFVGIVSESYYGWLRHYRTAFITSNKLPFNHPYVLGCLTTYEFAHVILNTDIQRNQDFLQLLTSSSSSSANSSRAIKSCRVLCHWASSINAISALTHALDLIDMFLVSDIKYDVSKETAFHRPWCLYLSAITIWIFEYFSGRNDRPRYAENLSLSQYLGRLRATLSRKGLDNRASLAKLAINPQVIYDKENIHKCEANVLLRQIIELLKASRWGVLQNRIKILNDVLSYDV
ncbi:hypothetical protein AWJ20_4478 [Sugiyamaella lignohabitans]|uniref:Xylanolytic transcriptional activator regulatory domain-containing protein n=1 Tax=Sugiyamaella lignohabitans TaxID=796027 RepID=A0A161HHK7_9ASCO|nr:uncharacterized protein AWJ20_4478 [Sugiyamaella lignohabitans]ANB11657.1 hypothetical protein AWJ20_4478 [Sugiyamaella lignohabitans]